MSELNWDKARGYLESLIEQYSGLVGMPRVNPWFALGCLSSLKDRLERGERTQELYDEIMECE